ncbi:unnamed protein product [Lampetra planeri]
MAPEDLEVDINTTLSEEQGDDAAETSGADGWALASPESGPQPSLVVASELGVRDSTKLLGVQVVLIAAYSIIILLGVVGNSLVIYLIARYRGMRTVTNYFIANLALADLLVNALCLPFTLAYTLTDEWSFGSVLCHLVPFSQALAVLVSTLTLTAIALDRQRCIVHHLESRLSQRVSFIIVSAIWGLGAVLACPLAVFREYHHVEFPGLGRRAVCTESWPGGQERDAIIYSVSMLVLQYVLPLCIITCAYARIWAKLRSHVSPGTSGRANVDRQCRRKKTTKMLLSVVVVFAVSWLPFNAFQLASDIHGRVLDLSEYKLVYTLFHVVAMCSTFANPFLYGWMNTNYRNGFLTVFRCERNTDAIRPETELASMRTRSLRDGPRRQLQQQQQQQQQCVASGVRADATSGRTQTTTSSFIDGRRKRVLAERDVERHGRPLAGTADEKAPLPSVDT